MHPWKGLQKYEYGRVPREERQRWHDHILGDEYIKVVAKIVVP